MKLYHGTNSTSIPEIHKEGVTPPDKTDELTTLLDKHRPEQFPERANSVFFSPEFDVVTAYDCMVVVDTNQIPDSIPKYIGNRRIADEISFSQESNDWGMGFSGSPDESAKKYWKHARVVEQNIPESIGVDDEVVFGGKVPPDAIVELRNC